VREKNPRKIGAVCVRNSSIFGFHKNKSRENGQLGRRVMRKLMSENTSDDIGAEFSFSFIFHLQKS